MLLKKDHISEMKILCILIFQLMFISVGHAGITLDGTMGTRGPLTGPAYTITSGMGQQAGGNLFHSFSISMQGKRPPLPDRTRYKT
jgi:hypothetical protein